MNGLRPLTSISRWEMWFMDSTAHLLPPILRDQRGLAFAAALDGSLALDPWQAAPLKLSHASDEVLWELARQFDVAGPLYQAMTCRAKKEQLVKMALRLQRKRGTPWAVEEVMRLLGYTDAKVLDRVNALIYNGEADHDGLYNFDAGFEEWSDYRIRLFMDDDSRAFTDYDTEQCELLAVEWAPLRCSLVGWHAQHIITSTAPEPAYELAQVNQVVLLDKLNNRQAAPRQWIQLFQDNAAIRWRVNPDEYTLSEVVKISLTDHSNNDLHMHTIKEVKSAPNVTLEGVWTWQSS